MKANRDGKPGGSALAARLQSTAEKKEQIIQKKAKKKRRDGEIRGEKNRSGRVKRDSERQLLTLELWMHDVVAAEFARRISCSWKPLRRWLGKEPEL